MKIQASIAMLLLAGFVATGNAIGQQGDKQETPPAKKDEVDIKKLMNQVSYLVGRNIAQNFKDSGAEFDLERVIEGIKEAAAGKESSISDEESQKIMMTFQQQMQKIQQAKAAEAQKTFMAEADKNLREGESFLKKNSTVQGVKQFESGLQIQILTAGTGGQPKSTDIVKIKYKGTLIDGTVFDQSAKGETTSLAVNQFIKGFSEGLMQMKVGSKCKFFIPGSIAYGMNVRPGSKIGPNATLIFEVELVEIVK